MRTLIVEFIPFNTNEPFEKLPRRNAGSPGREYHYLYTGNRKIRMGDWAVVHNGTEFGMVEIKRITPGIGDKVRKHVLAVITQDDFMTYEAANRGIAEHRAVFDELDYLYSQRKRMDKYKELEDVPEAAELLKKAQYWTGPMIEAHDVANVYTSAEEEASKASKASATATTPTADT